MRENAFKWHPYPQEKPNENNRYIISVRTQYVGFTTTSYWLPNKDVFDDMWDGCITAWAEMPKPYKEEEE